MISNTIIAKQTLADGRVLEYGERDPVTGQRFERVNAAPATTTTPASAPSTVGSNLTLEGIEGQIKQAAEQTKGLTAKTNEYLAGLNAPAGTAGTPATAPTTAPANDTATMDKIISTVNAYKSKYPEGVSGTREDLIEMLVRVNGEAYRQFAVDTVYRELRSPGEPEYKPPAYDVYGSSDAARNAKNAEELKKAEDAAKVAAESDNEIAKLTKQKELESLRTELGLDPKTGQKLTTPAVPSLMTDYEALRSSQGVAAVETQINTLTKTIADTEASLRQGLYDEEGRLAPMTVIGTRQLELKRQGQEQLDSLNRRKATLVDELNTKTTLISNLMNLKQTDYANAVDAYNTAFSQQITLMNILENRETKEDQEANQVKDDARANLNIIANAVKESGTSWLSVDPAIKAQVKLLEARAGLPQGIMEAFVTSNPTANVLAQTTGTDAEGNQIVTFIYADKNGMPGAVKTVLTGGVKEATGTGEGVYLKYGETEFELTDEGLDTALKGRVPYDQVYAALDKYTTLSATAIKEKMTRLGFKTTGEQAKATERKYGAGEINDLARKSIKGGKTKEEFLSGLPKIDATDADIAFATTAFDTNKTEYDKLSWLAKKYW